MWDIEKTAVFYLLIMMNLTKINRNMTTYTAIYSPPDSTAFVYIVYVHVPLEQLILLWSGGERIGAMYGSITTVMSKHNPRPKLRFLLSVMRGTRERFLVNHMCTYPICRHMLVTTYASACGSSDPPLEIGAT